MPRRETSAVAESSPEESIEILLVEDNPADVYLTTKALGGTRMAHRIHVAEDGVEALDFLLRRGRHAQAPRPQLILLDLNLPRKNGHEVLTEVKRHEHLRRIPVIVLTTSNAEDDVGSAYDLHANAYVEKPFRLERLREMANAIESFWLSVVTLPGA
jgi:chemotaxis family two-component system response regulator Rcp1